MCGLTIVDSRRRYCGVDCRERQRKITNKARSKRPHKYGLYKFRFEIFKRDNFKCQYCGSGVVDGARLAVDHIIPIAKGGTTNAENLITSCYACNLGKRDVLLSERALSIEKSYEYFEPNIKKRTPLPAPEPAALPPAERPEKKSRKKKRRGAAWLHVQKISKKWLRKQEAHEAKRRELIDKGLLSPRDEGVVVM